MKVKSAAYGPSAAAGIYKYYKQKAKSNEHKHQTNSKNEKAKGNSGQVQSS